MCFRARSRSVLMSVRKSWAISVLLIRLYRAARSGGDGDREGLEAVARADQEVALGRPAPAAAGGPRLPVDAGQGLAFDGDGPRLAHPAQLDLQIARGRAIGPFRRRDAQGPRARLRAGREAPPQERAPLIAERVAVVLVLRALRGGRVRQEETQDLSRHLARVLHDGLAEHDGARAH